MFPKDLFSIVAFRNLWIGQAISKFGDALYFIGFLFMVEKVTGRVDMVGYVGVAETLPYLLLSFYAGTLADRIDRKAIMYWSDVASGIVLALFVVATAINGKPPIWALFVCPFLLSSARAFFMPAKNASVPRVVPTNKVLAANAYSMMTDQLIWLGSMGLSGAVLAQLYSYSPTFFYQSFVTLNLVTFFVSAVFIRLLPTIEPENEKEHESVSSAIKNGLRYASKDRVILLTLISQIGISLFISPFFVVYIATNKEWFGGKPEVLALIESAFVLGLFLTSLFVMKFKVTKPGYAFGLAIGATGITIAMMAISKSLLVFVFWNFLAGVAIAFVDLPMMTYMQLAVPDAYRGRIMSIKNLIMMGIQPVGMGLGGQLVKALGISLTYAVMGVGFAISGVSPLLDRKFREVTMPTGQMTESNESDLPEQRDQGAKEPATLSP